jgi:hypothetical protein
MVTLRLEQMMQLFGTECLIALRSPCCAQAQGGHRGRPVRRMRLTPRIARGRPVLVCHKGRSTP